MNKHLTAFFLYVFWMSGFTRLEDFLEVLRVECLAAWNVLNN